MNSTVVPVTPDFICVESPVVIASGFIFIFSRNTEDIPPGHHHVSKLSYDRDHLSTFSH